MLYISGAQQLGATRSQLLFATSPFWGVTLAWNLFHERIQLAQLAAAPCIVAGLYLMLTARHEHEHTHEALAHTHGHRHDDGHFFFSSRRRHTRSLRDWSSDVCSSDLSARADDLAAAIILDMTRGSSARRFLIYSFIHRASEGGADRGAQMEADTAVNIELIFCPRVVIARSEERRVGKECRCRGRTAR